MAEEWQPLVTALVPTYNGAAFISRTLDSFATGEREHRVRSVTQRIDEALHVGGRDDVVVEREEQELAAGLGHEVVRVAEPPEVLGPLQDAGVRVLGGERTDDGEGVVG